MIANFLAEFYDLVAKTLNPYQGLKHSSLFVLPFDIGVAKTLNPYQGLKPAFKGFGRYYHYVAKTLNPYQGLKRPLVLLSLWRDLSQKP